MDASLARGQMKMSDERQLDTGSIRAAHVPQSRLSAEIPLQFKARTGVVLVTGVGPPELFQPRIASATVAVEPIVDRIFLVE